MHSVVMSHSCSQLFHTQFKKKYVDKGAALFKAETMYRLNLTFVLKHPSTDEFWRKDAMERLKRIEELLSQR